MGVPHWWKPPWELKPLKPPNYVQPLQSVLRPPGRSAALKKLVDGGRLPLDTPDNRGAGLSGLQLGGDKWDPIGSPIGHIPTCVQYWLGALDIQVRQWLTPSFERWSQKYPQDFFRLHHCASEETPLHLATALGDGHEAALTSAVAAAQFSCGQVVETLARNPGTSLEVRGAAVLKVSAGWIR